MIVSPQRGILFLEVDAEDRPLVLERFPEAQILDRPLDGDAILKEANKAEIISCFVQSSFDAQTLKKLPQLKLLCTRSVGYDHIDLEAAKKQRITVCNVPDYGSYVIAEHVFALLLGTLRHVEEGDKRVEGGTFDYHGLRGVALFGKTMGIVGTGRIGRHVAKIACGFGMNILAVDQCRTKELEEKFGVRYVSMEELLSGSDVVTLHLPATNETEHMLDRKAFKNMKQGVVLVNTARGTLIDSQALLAALNDGTVAHALLDVLEHEKNFEEDRALIDHPNVVTTPHIAFFADSSMRNMYLDAFQSINEFLSGKEPVHIIKAPAVVCDLPRIKKYT
ncbi:hypothetical protein HYZ99_05370 [Candidatus Peregrinibacteria bacterium]|nr:hypothetical protein [Candidatus Peregrinibacteria bacterium]